MKQWTVVAALSAALSLPVQALNLEYGGFYDRLKIVNKADYPLVSMAFYLNHREQRQPCQINGGVIVDRGNELPLVVGPRQELLVPFDAELKDHKAVLSLDVVDEAQCDFAMQLRYSDTAQQRFTDGDWQAMVSQFDGVLKRFAGFPFRWLQPDVSGVVVKLAEGSDMVPAKWEADQDGRVTILLSELNGEAVRFSQPPVWISPYIER
ncbi:DUF2987 domain-containing protein [Ferrimonas balearica]|uniref:DUF2987 domain-containing protein n=1 Tax=Ferrimonas balearica TaxID=44012 RepID=UPI001C56FC54|nr:DUF2987 domain-containing protein [Ferrimonas balearica]MBW3139027.1 DUF2987 domain-containing protein [Ferrimonas balearica]MBW3163381.1 DUF2987 domain-containing protein [Ferrimonas balearica]MBY6106089.1 DUF2987 domain-containing protein [Ferrimonas balearica]